MKIRDFLKIKGYLVITIGPDETVSVAIQKLIENNIGAMPVCSDKGVLLGIISERDLLKECFHQGPRSDD
jgi:CBS domain-containing protein